MHFSEQSLRSAQALPNRRVTSSRDVGWTSMLLERHASDGSSDIFDVEPTVDQTIVVGVGGMHDLDVFKAGRWRTITMSPGCIGTNLPGESSRLRWRSAGSKKVFETAHLYMPAAIFTETFDDHRRVGQAAARGLISMVGMSDPVLHNTVLALLAAMQAGAEDLYAQSARTWIAAQLLWRSGLVHLDQNDEGATLKSDRRIARALEMIRHHFSEDLSLDALASESGMSKYHFLRLFRRMTGRTPWQYLAGLRLDAAHRLLVATDLSVAEVGMRCGYKRANNFTSAFGRRFGVSPRELRAQGHRE